MSAIVLVISLWTNACIEGTLHGEPQTLCREFQIHSYPTVEACENTRDKVVGEWLDSLKPYNLAPRIVGVRCGPADEGNDI